jgi:hypothetical protein
VQIEQIEQRLTRKQWWKTSSIYPWIIKKKKKKEAEAGAKPDAIRVAQNPTREEK